MEPAERPNEAMVSILCFTAESKVCERNKSPVWVLDCHPVPELPIKYELQDSEETEKSNAPSHLPRGWWAAMSYNPKLESIQEEYDG